MNSKKILILEPFSLKAVSIAKYLKQKGGFIVEGLVSKRERFGIAYYDRFAIGDIDSFDFSDYKFVFPTGYESTKAFFERFKRFGYEGAICFDEKNLISCDKRRMIELADSLGVPTPKTYESIAEIDSFPIFYKESHEIGGGERGVAYSADEIPLRGNLICQEYIESPYTYGVGFLAKDGEILTYTTQRELISYPKIGGSAILVDSFFDERILEYTKRVCQEICYNGWGLAEYKYCKKRDDFVFMEINAKTWASIEFMLANNPLFLNYLFGLEYQHVKTDKMLFINRLIKLGALDAIAVLLKHQDATKLFELTPFFIELKEFCLKKIAAIYR